MQQFDVCRLKSPATGLVLILQHDIVDDLSTRIVAPLSDKPHRHLIERLRLPVVLDGNRFVVQLDRMAAINRQAIGDRVGNLASEEQRVKNALDLIFFGF